MATLPLLLSAYLSKPSNIIYVSKVYYYDKNLTLTQNMPGNLSFSENDFLLNSGLITVYYNLINYVNLINPIEIPAYTPLSSLQYGDYFINPFSNNFQPTQIIQDLSSSNVNNSKIINFVASVDTDDLNFGTVKPDYTNVLTNINNNLSSLVSKNNQSEITQKLSDIFEYTLQDNSKASSMKAQNVTESNKPFSNIIYQLLRLMSLFSNTDSFGNYGYTNIPAKSTRFLNDIVLAISSLGSASDNQAIKALKDTISALEIKADVNNVMQIDGTQEFRLRPFAKNYDDNDVEEI